VTARGGLHPELRRVWPLLARDVRAQLDRGVTLVSAYRSPAQQRALYRAYRAGRGGRAAPPGQSAHQRGLAIDVLLEAPRGAEPWAWALTWRGRRAYRRLHELARRYGLEPIVDAAPDDPYHLQVPGWRTIGRGARPTPARRRRRP